jgi:hypothetical protein
MAVITIMHGICDTAEILCCNGDGRYFSNRLFLWVIALYSQSTR